MTWLKRKQTLVEAFQNDGTDERAAVIAAWINLRGGKATAFPKNTYDVGGAHFLPYAIVRLDAEDILTRVIGPSFWVIDMGDGRFVGVPDSVMVIAYEVVDITKEQEVEEPPC